MKPGPTMRASAAASLLLALSVTLFGCAAEDATDTPDPAPSTPQAPPSDPTASPGTSERPDPQVGGTNTGMDVRTLNPDGSVSTVEVRDFPR